MSWSEADKARAIGIARTTDAHIASKRTGIPRRTISRWLTNAGPVTSVIRDETATEVGRMAWSGIIEILEETKARIHDPATRPGELASLLDVHLKAHGLVTGGPTANVRYAGVNVNVEAGHGADLWTDDEAEAVRRSIDEMDKVAAYTDTEFDAWERDGIHPDGSRDDKPGSVQLIEFHRSVSDVG